MIVIAVILILLGIFVAGLGWLLWVGIGVLIVGLILNLTTVGPGSGGRRWRYY